MYIDISKRQAILDYNFGTDLCLDILKHELCHYMVYMDKGHCGDGEADFEKRLAIVGASSSGVTPERLKVSKVKQHYYVIHDIYHVYKKDNSFMTKLTLNHTEKAKYNDGYNYTYKDTPVIIKRENIEIKTY